MCPLGECAHPTIQEYEYPSLGHILSDDGSTQFGYQSIKLKIMFSDTGEHLQ